MKAINYIVIFLMMSILVKNFTKINKHISFHNYVERLFSKENKKEKVILTFVIATSMELTVVIVPTDAFFLLPVLT